MAKLVSNRSTPAETEVNGQPEDSTRSCQIRGRKPSLDIQEGQGDDETCCPRLDSCMMFSSGDDHLCGVHSSRHQLVSDYRVNIRGSSVKHIGNITKIYYQGTSVGENGKKMPFKYAWKRMSSKYARVMCLIGVAVLMYLYRGFGEQVAIPVTTSESKEGHPSWISNAIYDRTGVFPDIACQGATLQIACDMNNWETIQIISADYGRRNAYRCTHPTRSQNLNCSSPNATRIVSRICNFKTRCRVLASNSLFGDPCENTDKYLEIRYRCIKPDIACEGSTLRIACDRTKGETIQIFSANYGRTNEYVCFHRKIWDLNCVSLNTTAIVHKRCNSKTECKVLSSNSVFGDPCPHTHKYLEVKYSCVQPGVACEGSTIRITCDKSKGETIKILGANYGRTNGYWCSRPNIWDLNCTSVNAIGIMSKSCNAMTECSVLASNSVFGDPCQHTHKYLEVQHSCVKPDLACEGSTLRIACDKNEGETIEILSANYGRTDGYRCFHPNSQDYNCRSTDAKRIMSRSCNWKTQCNVLASNSVFGDPCQHTYKYLTVQHICIKPDIACEGTVLRIACDITKGETLLIVSANYGRTNEFRCFHRAIYSINCTSTNATEVVSRSCNSKTECRIWASNSVFGNPCGATKKYLEVQHRCIQPDALHRSPDR